MADELDAEAVQLFYAGTSQRPAWDDFTERQKDHWRAIARKAREMHKAGAWDEGWNAAASWPQGDINPYKAATK